MRGKVACIIAALFAGGCERQQSDCDFLAPGYTLLTDNLARLPDIPIVALPANARVTVERCYPTHPYDHYLGPFNFVGAKRATNGNIYLIYEPLLITDVELVFELGPHRRPLKGFAYSTL